MTTRMRRLVLCKRTQPRVAIRRTALQPRCECGHDDRLDVAEDGNPREDSKTDRGKRHEHRGAEPRATAAQRSRDEASRADWAEDAARATACGFVPLAASDAADNTR